MQYHDLTQDTIVKGDKSNNVGNLFPADVQAQDEPDPFPRPNEGTA